MIIVLQFLTYWKGLTNLNRIYWVKLGDYYPSSAYKTVFFPFLASHSPLPFVSSGRHGSPAARRRFGRLPHRGSGEASFPIVNVYKGWMNSDLGLLWQEKSSRLRLIECGTDPAASAATSTTELGTAASPDQAKNHSRMRNGDEIMPTVGMVSQAITLLISRTLSPF